ncbi:MAG: hypothetical protein Q4G04_01350 [bacterium]|nr:hypothetical protein [bacterium]
MNSDFELFLSNIKVKLNSTVLQQDNNDIPKENIEKAREKIIFFEERILEDFNFGVVTLEVEHPTISLEEIILKQGKVNMPISELGYDTSLIIIYHDKEKNVDHTISDLFYSSKKTKIEAQNEYNKLHDIIFNAKTVSDIFKILNKTLENV